MVKTLEGTLKIMRLVKNTYRTGDVIGRIPGDLGRYLVKNGRNRGTSFLARIGRRIKGMELPITYFISSHNNNGLNGLLREEYVFLAKWDDSMERLDEEVTVDDINFSFDPGNIPWTFYVEMNGKSDYKILRIRNEDSIDISNTPTYSLIDKLPKKGARMILAQEGDAFDRMNQVIRDRNLTPVIINYLRYRK